MKCLVLIALLGIPFTTSAEVTVQGPPEETKDFLTKGQSQVTLTGESSSTFEASQVSVEVYVSTDGAAAGAALTLHDEQKRNLLNRIQAAGIAPGQITVPKFATLSPKFGAAGTPIGYTATSVLTVEISDQKQYVDLASTLDKSREARLGELSYDHVQLANIQKQVLAGACKRVMTKKEVYEQALGVTLRPVSFSEIEGGQKGNDSDPSRFGQMTIKSAVKIVFEIEPAAAGASAPKPVQPPTPEAPAQP